MKAQVRSTRKERGFTLLELLVIIVLVGIVSTTYLNLGGWTCASEIRNDFHHFNGFLQSLRAKALSNNRAMQAEYHKDGLLHVHSNVGRQARGTQACSGSQWDWEGEAVDLIVKRANFGTTADFKICFYPDGTATAKTVFVEGTCGEKVHRYRTQIFGATGFFETAKKKLNAATWTEL